jgi:hypothetical protein
MPIFGSSMPARRHIITAAAIVAAMTMVGAIPNPYPDVAKTDRVPSPADCRNARAPTVDCLGIVLPQTAGEIIEVAPGLSLVGQVPG